MPTTPYITAADIRAYLPQTRDTDAPLMNAIAVRATDRVNAALGFTFSGYAVGTRVVSTYGGKYLHLPPHQQGSVTAVLWGTYTVPSSYYREQPDGALYYQSPWGHPTWGIADYSVTAAYGYGQPPEVIQQVTLEVAVNIWRSKEKGSFTDDVGVEGSGGQRFVGGLTRQQRADIDAIKAQYGLRVVV